MERSVIWKMAYAMACEGEDRDDAIERAAGYAAGEWGNYCGDLSPADTEAEAADGWDRGEPRGRATRMVLAEQRVLDADRQSGLTRRSGPGSARHPGPPAGDGRKAPPQRHPAYLVDLGIITRMTFADGTPGWKASRAQADGVRRVAEQLAREGGAEIFRAEGHGPEDCTASPSASGPTILDAGLTTGRRWRSPLPAELDNPERLSGL